jgi:hypothetical protein
MLPTLRALLGVLGVSAILICLSIMILGAGATAATAERAFDALTGWRGPPSPPWPPTMDSELRFYAPFWGVYGIILVAVARDMRRRGHLVPWLAAVFFAGGVGRAISWFSVGPPHPFFLTLMAVELLTPPVLVILGRGAKSN